MGVIGLDIDGTVTDNPFSMSPKISDYLEMLSSRGWHIIFITGRPFVWGCRPLLHLKFRYWLAVINGANILQMPEQKLIADKMLTNIHFDYLDRIFSDEATDYVLYRGVEENDICYYRPQRFSKQRLEYLRKRAKHLGETWIAVEDYSRFTGVRFASIKGFGSAEKCWRLADSIDKTLGYHVSVIRDPHDDKTHVVQATRPECDKGVVLSEFAAYNGYADGPIIAAGDDYNDITMLKSATFRIVMSTAPSEVLKLADYVAPPASQLGIIDGLQHAIEFYNKMD